MTTKLNEKAIFFREKAFDFAQRYIASRPELNSQRQFPTDIWEKMGRENLLGLGIPEEFGGQDGDYLSIAVAGKAFVEGGNNLGCALSWIMHQIIARFFILGHGSSKQHKTYLPDMARGKITACLAISEPEGGGHPKYLTTKASYDGTHYIITGEKTFLTNAPVADLFIVFAIGSLDGERKRFSAFFVPKGLEGLKLAEPLDLGFLYPCPHGGIILNRCQVTENDVLGRPLSAYEDMALPFREVEDAMIVGPITGGFKALLNHVLGLIKDQDIPLREDLDARLGEIVSTINTLEILAYEASSILDENTHHPELLSILIFCRRVAAETVEKISELVSVAGIRKDPLYEMMTNDLVRSMRIASNVAEIKQKKLGRSLFS
jgi:alkylation response protein AidB-like acyl-CoA dehydrogenase